MASCLTHCLAGLSLPGLSLIFPCLQDFGAEPLAVCAVLLSSLSVHLSLHQARLLLSLIRECGVPKVLHKCRGLSFQTV